MYHLLSLHLLMVQFSNQLLAHVIQPIPSCLRLFLCYSKLQYIYMFQNLQPLCYLYVNCYFLQRHLLGILDFP
uniref:Putative secreted protein n=1 Tax=Panstrongylus lignarius TaxID=156445 RepID=A0A224XTZ1_9HEMI